MKKRNGKWRYKNLTIAALGFLMGLFFLRFEAFHNFLIQLGNLGYIGAFIAGIFFVSTFSVATSAVVLLVLAEFLSPIEIGLVAGLGAVVGDMLIFRFVKDNLVDEIEDVYNHIDKEHHLQKLFHTKYFNWMLPVIGSAIIASPLPDEIGVSLIGISKMNNFKFFLLSYILNSVGIFLIISASVVIKP